MSAPEPCGCFVDCRVCDGRGGYPEHVPREGRSVRVTCDTCAGNGIVSCPEPAVDQRVTGVAVCAVHLRWTLPSELA